MIKKEEANKILKGTDALRYLSYKQLFTLIWWDLFNSRKSQKFLEYLKMGKWPTVAFYDAKYS